MPLHKFYGGVHPPTRKKGASGPSRKAKIPVRVVIPLLQHTGGACEPVVAAGDRVRTGALIGKSVSYISSPVHASISGNVTKVALSPHPAFNRALSVTIESDGVIPQEEAFVPRSAEEVRALSREELVGIVRDAGIVGLGGAAFPTHVKLSPPRDKKIGSLLLNGAECEPFLTCDERLMCERSEEIVTGAEIIAGILDVDDIRIAIEDNKPSAAAAMRAAVSAAPSGSRVAKAKVVVLKTRYPQGAEKQLIKSVLGREVPAGGLPMDVGCVVHNVGTVFAVSEAVHLGKPLIERCVTVAGSCIREPKNLVVRIGTLVSDLVQECGGFTRPPSKVIFGGPMMGIAQYTMDLPVVKGTSGIIFFPKEEVEEVEEGVCIRCARCVGSCPIKLAPTTLANLVKKARWVEAKERGVAYCIECGVCAYECPAKIPLVDYMKLGKARLAALR